MCGKYLRLSIAIALATYLNFETIQPTTTGLQYLSSNSNHKIRFSFNVDQYEQGKHCYIRESNTENKNFVDIYPCPDTISIEGGIFGICVRLCNAGEAPSTMDLPSLPRKDTKYIFISKHDSSTPSPEYMHRGIVYGLQTPILIYPLVTMVSEESSLKLSIELPKNTSCNILPNLKSNERSAPILNLQVILLDLSYLVLYYKINCFNHPTYFYPMPNKYMRENIEVFKYQYYVESNGLKINDQYEYNIIFTNTFGIDICEFTITNYIDEVKNIDSPHINKFHAPCRNTTFLTSYFTQMFKIGIKNRYGINDVRIKAVLSRRDDENKDTFFIQSSSVETQVNLGLLMKDANNKILTTCSTLIHQADILTYSPVIVSSCCGIVASNSECTCQCDTIITFSNLKPGRPYYIEINLTIRDDDDDDSSADITERFFFRTKESEEVRMSFKLVREALAESIVLSLSRDKIDDISYLVTCTFSVGYLNSDMFKDVGCYFSDAMCRTPCFENGVIQLKFQYLGNYNALKVVTSKIFGVHVYELKLTRIKWKAKYEFLKNGFKASGVISDRPSLSIGEFSCYYKVWVRKEDKLLLRYDCAETNMNLLFSLMDNEEKPQTGVAKCDKIPRCDEVIYNHTYNPSAEYLIAMISHPLLDEVFKRIDSKLIPLEPSDEAKRIHVRILRIGKMFVVETTLPPSVTTENSKCLWYLSYLNIPERAIIKRCTYYDNELCPDFSSCTKFNITNVDDISDYHLQVILVGDDSIFGVAQIYQNQAESVSKISYTMIIAIGVVAAIIVTGITILVIAWWIYRR